MFATHKTAIDYSRFLAVDIICMHVYSELIVNFKTQDINCAHGAKNSLYAGLRISPLVHILGEVRRVNFLKLTNNRVL